MMTKTVYKVPERVQREVELWADGLASGESSRGVCPKCLGGSSGEKSFLCSRSTSGIAHFICFRASCGYRGTVDLVLGPGSTPVPKKTHRMMRGLETLDKHQVKWYREKFDINPGTEVYWCPSVSRYAYRVYGPTGGHRGWILRDFNGYGQGAKSLAYKEKEDEPFIGWFDGSKPGDFHPVIVVEDIVSARKVSDAGFKSVSLNGANALGFEEIYEIRAETPSIIIALDRGMLPLSIRYRSKYEILFDDIVIWQLDKDLKYVDRTRIREGVINGRADFIGNS